MKKIIMLLFASALFLSTLTGCAKAGENNADSTAAQTNESTATTANSSNGTPTPEPEQASPVSDFEYEENDKGGITITKYIGNDVNVVIPSSIENKTVTKVASNILADSATVTRIVIPKVVQNINEYAFNNSNSLKQVIFEGNAPENFLYAIPCNITFTIYYYSNANGFSFPRWNGYPTRIIGNDTQVPVHSNFEYMENQDGTILISEYLGNNANVVIPEKINNKNVTKIGIYAFKNNDIISSITLPDTVTEIDQRAFYNCNALADIVLSKNIKTIEEKAFYSCDKLSSITFPNTLTNLGNDSFSNCEALKNVQIPNSVTNWGQNVFMHSGVETLTLAEGLTKLGERAFSGTAIKEITLPNSLTTIPKGAFGGCWLLESITWGKNLTTIGESAFWGIAIKTLTLPESLRILSEEAFADCYYLKSVTLNNGLTTIEKYAFKNVNVLTEIIIPESVEIITETVFDSCFHLKKVMFEGNAPISYTLPDVKVYGMDYTVYYHANAKGFTSPTWNNYKTEVW